MAFAAVAGDAPVRANAFARERRGGAAEALHVGGLEKAGHADNLQGAAFHFENSADVVDPEAAGALPVGEATFGALPMDTLEPLVGADESGSADPESPPAESEGSPVIDAMDAMDDTALDVQPPPQQVRWGPA
jgi:hypothetical protein